MVRNNILKFDAIYFAFTILFFLIELTIAMYVHDSFVRPYLGDVLVVVLIYCFIKSFLKIKIWKTALFVLLFSFAIEFLQYLNIVEKLNLQHSKIARTVLGTSFCWHDILCYVVGIALVISVEYLLRKEKL